MKFLRLDAKLSDYWLHR